MALTATYSPEDNKLRLYADARLPRDLYDRVRAAGFVWAAKQALFVAPAWTPEREDLLRLGPLIENHERFPERTNVQLVRVDGPRDITVGVWER